MVILFLLKTMKKRWEFILPTLFHCSYQEYLKIVYFDDLSYICIVFYVLQKDLDPGKMFWYNFVETNFIENENY